ncbi:MAG: sulfurtransferase TusA family protein [Pseudomonadota bacterium]
MKADLEIDATGLLCPLPVLRLRKRMQGLAAGQTARLLATDPAAHIDVPHFCVEAGHEYLGAEDRVDATAFLIRKGPD